MGRASGKKTPRQMLEDLLGSDAGGALEGLPQAGRGAEQTTGVRAEEGIGAPRDIPGGKNHIANPATPNAYRDPPPIPEREWPYRRALLAHGVVPDGQHADRDPRLTNPGTRARPKLDAPKPLTSPVPVYIVERDAGKRPTSFVDTRHVTLPIAGNEPAMIAPANPSRTLVQLLNEDSTHNARFGRLEDLQYDSANAVITGGSRLPSGASGYTVFRTQDALYGVSETSSTVAISVILENELRGMP